MGIHIMRKQRKKKTDSLQRVKDGNHDDDLRNNSKDGYDGDDSYDDGEDDNIDNDDEDIEKENYYFDVVVDDHDNDKHL
ncbi:hypothetical protein ElyMa_004815900 [Elysia marginata]|uniref:Uncharacterized protein n=1 Tax=Elysia marginata TaxID=1093978 RepID=A0AAV4IMP9_9GAST|nr:hypothetical protein ElyMa_004815900 [Elysia marginata]